jgi:hypothetical protein
MRRSFAILFAIVPSLALASQAIDLTQDEFKMYRHWQKAMQDPRVEKMSPDKRNAAIAKDAHFKLKELESAIQKGESAGDLKAICIANLREALESVLPGAIAKVEVDTTEPHAVAYIQWSNENVKQLSGEASLIAASAAKQCPVVSTIQVWATDKANPKVRVFQALISQSAASRISMERAREFADTRYIRLFENVKSAANGDTFEVIPDAGADTGAK